MILEGSACSGVQAGISMDTGVEVLRVLFDLVYAVSQEAA